MQRHFLTPEGARQQGAEQRRAMQRIQQFLRQGAVIFDLAGMARDDGGDPLGAFCGGFAANIAGLGDFLRCTHATASSRFRAGSRHWVKALSQPGVIQSFDQIPCWVIFVNFQPPGCPRRESA